MTTAKKGNYPAFGEYLKDILMLSVPPDRPKNFEESVRVLYDNCKCDKFFKNCPEAFPTRLSDVFVYTPEAFRAWRHGKIDGRKPLSKKTLKYIILCQLGKPGLHTVSALRYWLSLGRPNYLALLDDPDILSLIKELNLPEGRHITQTNLLPRVDLHNTINTTFQWCQDSNTHALGLFGMPGNGKKTALRAWAYFPTIYDRYDQVIELSDIEREDADLFLLGVVQLLGEIPGRNAKKQLQEINSRKRILYLWYDASHPTHLEALLDSLVPSGFLALTTANYTPIARFLAEKAIIQAEGITWNEVQRLAELQAISVDETSLADLHQAHEYQHGNILGLLKVLSLAKVYGWEETLQMMRQQPAEQPVSQVEDSLFGILYGPYQQLTPTMRQAAALLGVLPAFHSYTLNTLATLWGLEDNLERARGWANEIQKHTVLLSNAGHDRWKMHSQDHLFVQSLFRNLPAEQQEQAQGWLRRRVQADDIQSWYYDAFEDASQTKLREQLRPEKVYRLADLFERQWIRAGIKALCCPWKYKSHGWAAMQAYPSRVSSDAYARGYALERVIRRHITIASGVFYLLLALLVQPFDVTHWLGQMPVSWLAQWLRIFWRGLLGVSVVAGLVGLPLWWIFGPPRRFPLMWARLWKEQDQIRSSDMASDAELEPEDIHKRQSADN